MKCNPWRWLWGLVPVLVLGWAAVQIEHLKIERDLSSRAKGALASAGLNWAEVSLSGRDAFLSGRASEDDEPARALQVVHDTWGVRVVDNGAGLIDVAEKYEWSAIRREDRIRLNGVVPSERTRRDVIGIAKATFPTLEIEDRLRLARGAPPLDIWLGGVGFGIKQLSLLKAGRVDLSMTNLTLVGEAIDVRAFRSVKAALRTGLPPGITLKTDRVSPPVVKPFTWTLNVAQGQATFAGHVPDEKTREELLAAIARTGASAKIVDDMQPADGEPDAWAGAALAAAKAVATLEEGAVEMRDTSISVTGIAETKAKADAARAQLRESIAAPFQVSSNIATREPVIPNIAPYVTSATLQGGTLVLDGYVPSENAQHALASFARQRMPGVDVRTDTQLGAGQPDGWHKCIEAGIDALALLGSGAATVSGSQLQFAATTQAEKLAGEIPGRLRASVGDGCSVDARITLDVKPEPQLRWSAAYDSGELTLSGQVAGDDTRTALLARAKELFPNAQVIDRMTVLPESSQRWSDAAREGLTLLSRLRRGQADLVEQDLTITGEAMDGDAQGAIRAAISSNMPTGYRAQENTFVRASPTQTPKSNATSSLPTASIETPSAEAVQRKEEADACQNLLQSTAKKGVIEFARGTAELDQDSFATLERLAEVAIKCPAVRFEVGGHADSDGMERNNQRLSERRAQSVVDFLIKAGVAEGRMQAVGYGTTQPLAPNTTAENKARNRRIEFFVKVD